MVNKLLSAFEGSNTPVAFTQNGAMTLPSTGDRVLDLFSQIGALTDPYAAVRMFEAAYSEEPQMAVRCALWSRDIRGGAGRRESFRQILKWLELNDFEMFKRVVSNATEFGRWDDILVAQTERGKKFVFGLVARALAAKDGLCAKWMPRKGPIAIELQAFLGLNPPAEVQGSGRRNPISKQYRKLLVSLTNVVETAMCNREWSVINYNHTPSVAGKRYAKAFRKRDGARYQAWLDSLKTADPKDPKAPKINTEALYPFDVRVAMREGQTGYAEAAWSNLPNWIADNVAMLPVVDVSGSMTTKVQNKVQAMDVSISLGLYTAERNKSVFKNRMITFSQKADWIVVNDSMTLAQKFHTIETAAWQMNTNLQSVFDLVLDTAVKNKVAAEDMPTHLLIISDMEFDTARGSNAYASRYSRTDRQTSENFAAIEQKYQRAGYARPKIIFWNVNGRPGNSPVHRTETDTALVSGFSPAILRTVLSQKVVTPTDAMLETLMKDRYNIFA